MSNHPTFGRIFSLHLIIDHNLDRCVPRKGSTLTYMNTPVQLKNGKIRDVGLTRTIPYGRSMIDLQFRSYIAESNRDEPVNV